MVSSILGGRRLQGLLHLVLGLAALDQLNELDYYLDIIFHFSIGFFSAFGSFLNHHPSLTKYLVFGSREVHLGTLEVWE